MVHVHVPAAVDGEISTNDFVNFHFMKCISSCHKKRNLYVLKQVKRVKQYKNIHIYVSIVTVLQSSASFPHNIQLIEASEQEHQLKSAAAKFCFPGEKEKCICCKKDLTFLSASCCIFAAPRLAPFERRVCKPDNKFKEAPRPLPVSHWPLRGPAWLLEARWVVEPPWSSLSS